MSETKYFARLMARVRAKPGCYERYLELLKDVAPHPHSGKKYDRMKAPAAERALLEFHNAEMAKKATR